MLSQKSNTCRRLLLSVHRQADQLILLPHTINGNVDLLAELGSNTHLFCRELQSYRYVSCHVTKANVYIAHDMALYVDWNRYVTNTAGAGDSPWSYDTYFNRARYWVKDQLLLNKCYIKSGKTLYALRTDKEQTDLEFPKGNLDISRMFKTGHLTPLNAYQASYRMLRFLNHFNLIKTNRLHVCIGAALLGKTVHFYPNNYYKNHAVYKYSLKSLLPNVVWCN